MRRHPYPGADGVRGAVCIRAQPGGPAGAGALGGPAHAAAGGRAERAARGQHRVRGGALGGVNLDRPGVRVGLGQVRQPGGWPQGRQAAAHARVRAGGRRGGARQLRVAAQRGGHRRGAAVQLWVEQVRAAGARGHDRPADPHAGGGAARARGGERGGRVAAHRGGGQRGRAVRLGLEQVWAAGVGRHQRPMQPYCGVHPPCNHHLRCSRSQ
mmetsp:Transcript_29924/g.76220  ORF Transcript_29924/g.76220 Transcript_29924/m.76220 type:complete len:212 (+) Transcript_29924:531-1166(+)